MKKIFLILSLCCLFFGMLSTAGAADADDILVYLNGNLMQFDVEPCIMEERTMVPLRGIFEKLGATVSWDDETRSATGVSSTRTVVFTVDSHTYTVNFIPHTLDVAPCIVNSRTLIPLRAVSESLECTVDWHAEYRSVIIATPDWDSTGWTVPRPEFTYTEEERLYSTSNFFEMNAYYEKQNQTPDYLDLVTVYDSSAGFYLDNAPITFSSPAKVINSRTMVPLREMMELLGATVTWDSETDKISVQKDSISLTLTPDSNTLENTGIASKTEIPVLRLDGTVYMPISVISQLEYTTAWDSEKNAIMIASPALYINPIPTDFYCFESQISVPDPSSVWTFSSVIEDPNGLYYRYPSAEFTEEMVSIYVDLLYKCAFSEKIGRPGVYESATHTVQLSTILDGASYFQISITPLEVYNKYANKELTFYTTHPKVPDFGINCGVNGGTTTQGPSFDYTYMVKANHETLIAEYSEMLLAAGFKAISSDSFWMADGDKSLLICPRMTKNYVIISIYTFSESES